MILEVSMKRLQHNYNVAIQKIILLEKTIQTEDPIKHENTIDKMETQYALLTKYSLIGLDNIQDQKNQIKKNKKENTRMILTNWHQEIYPSIIQYLIPGNKTIQKLTEYITAHTKAQPIDVQLAIHRLAENGIINIQNKKIQLNYAFSNEKEEIIKQLKEIGE